jgi:uncharacterized protein (TIGR02996 family)
VKSAPKAAAPATRSLAEVLEAARAAVARDDFAAALTALLDAWKAIPAAAIADAIDRVGERAQAKLKPPTGKTPKERNDAWNKAAKQSDVVIRGVLLASLTETKGNVETLERIELLIKHSDPRIAKRLGDLVETPIYNASVSRTRLFWKRLFELLPKLGDPRLIVRQRGFAKAWQDNEELNDPERPELAKRLAAVGPAMVEAYGDGPPELSTDDEARCAAVVAAIRAPASTGEHTEAELLAEIYAAPDDDQVRMVYADWLTEHDDPRGEFIVLQLVRARGEQTKEQAQREKDLLAEYMTRWLEPFDGRVMKASVRFERGFLAAAKRNENSVTALDDNPAWATLRELNTVPGSDACRVPGLRVLVDMKSDDIECLARQTRPLGVEELSWQLDQFYRGEYTEETQSAIVAFAKITVLPKLVRLAAFPDWLDREYDRPIRPANLEWAWKSPVSANLEELTLAVHHRLLPEWITALTPTKIARITLYDPHVHSGWRYMLGRDEGGALSRLTVVAPYGSPPAGEWPPQYGRELVAGIEALRVNTLTSARVAIPPAAWSGTAKLRKSLAAAFTRQKRLADGVTIEQATR